MGQTPIYTHDCDDCIWLGRIDHDHYGEVDVYVHFRDSVGSSELIYRYGSDGPDYGCFTVSVVRETVAHGPARRARGAGPIPDGHIASKLLRRFNIKVIVRGGVAYRDPQADEEHTHYYHAAEGEVFPVSAYQRLHPSHAVRPVVAFALLNH